MEKSPKKAIILLVLLLVLALAAIFGAGYLFRLFIAIGEAQKHGIAAFRLPEIQQVGLLSIFTADKAAHPDAFKFSCIIMGSVFFFVFLGIAGAMNPKQALYGSARFANISEIKQAKLLITPKEINKGGLFAGDAIIVGKLGNNYIGLRGQQLVYLAAPTRSGKGTGVVNPVALSYNHSMVVLDIKKELFNISAAYRRANGQKVYLFDPYNADGRTAKWNPCSYIRRDYKLRENDVQKISQSLIPLKGRDEVWDKSARNLLNGLILYCLDKENHDKSFTTTLRAVYDLTANLDGEKAIPYFLSLLTASFVSKQTKQTINAAITAAENTFLSVIFTLNTALAPFKSELVSDAMSGDDFDLRNMRREKITVYLGFSPDDLEQAAPLVNLFYTQLINENTRADTHPDTDSTQQYQCLLLMDEGTAPGRIEILKKAVSYMAGFNVRMLLIVQSPAQLRDDELYGKYGAKNILSNCALKVMYTPNDYDDADEYSKLLGNTTVSARTSKNIGRGGNSQTVTQNSRPLRYPQELLAMSAKKVIIRLDGLPYPIDATKNCYYKDKNFLHFQKHGRLIARKNNERVSVSGSLNKPQNTATHYFDEIKNHYPNEFKGLYYSNSRHFVVNAAIQSLEEVFC